MSDPGQRLKDALRAELKDRLAARGLSEDHVNDERISALLAELDEKLDLEADRLATELQPKLVEAAPAEAIVEEESFLRLCLNLRLQHFVMLSSVLVLIVTGLPLKFHDAKLSHVVMDWFGGIATSAFIHRLGATALIGVGVYHLLYTLFSRSGRRDFLLLLPNLKDLRDYLLQIKYFLGKTTEKARFGRFSYIEKFDYWAVYWGMVIMIGSGSLLWFENIALQILPKFILDIAKEAHSDEALLATLAIIIWHFYNVHLNPHKFPISKTFITGRISKKEMMEEHGLEYDEVIRRRTLETGGNKADVNVDTR